MQSVNCDAPKSKGGINHVDLIKLAKSMNIAVPPKILKRDLCTLINKKDVVAFPSKESKSWQTVKSTKSADAPAQPDKHENLQPLTNFYDIKEELGAGSFGLVLRAIDKTSGEEVALKLLHSLTDSSKREVAILVNASKIYNGACSKNIICYKDQFAALYKQNGNERRFEVIVTDFIKGKTLEKWIGEKGAPSKTTLKKWARQLFGALDLCHSHDISHLDVKPSNIMIRDKSNDLVLIDFGISCVETSTTHQPDHCKNQGGGTIVYMSPNYLKECFFPKLLNKDCTEEVRQKTDNWAAALSLLDSATEFKYLSEIDKIGTKYKIFDGTDNDRFENQDDFIKEIRTFVKKNPPQTGDKALNERLQYNLDNGGL